VTAFLRHCEERSDEATFLFWRYLEKDRESIKALNSDNFRQKLPASTPRITTIAKGDRYV
jgi:hypothetical protein